MTPLQRELPYSVSLTRPQDSRHIFRVEYPKRRKDHRREVHHFLRLLLGNEELFATFTNLPVNAVSPKVKLSQKMLKQHPAVPNMSSR